MNPSTLPFPEQLEQETEKHEEGGEQRLEQVDLTEQSSIFECYTSFSAPISPALEEVGRKIIFFHDSSDDFKRFMITLSVNLIHKHEHLNNLILPLQLGFARLITSSVMFLAYYIDPDIAPNSANDFFDMSFMLMEIGAVLASFPCFIIPNSIIYHHMKKTVKKTNNEIEAEYPDELSMIGDDYCIDYGAALAGFKLPSTKEFSVTLLKMLSLTMSAFILFTLSLNVMEFENLPGIKLLFDLFSCILLTFFMTLISNCMNIPMRNTAGAAYFGNFVGIALTNNWLDNHIDPAAISNALLPATASFIGASIPVFISSVQLSFLKNEQIDALLQHRDSRHILQMAAQWYEEQIQPYFDSIHEVNKELISDCGTLIKYCLWRKPSSPEERNAILPENSNGYESFHNNPAFLGVAQLD